jgi:hypothetical protein
MPILDIYFLMLKFISFICQKSMDDLISKNIYIYLHLWELFFNQVQIVTSC